MLGGILSTRFESFGEKLRTLVVNSLLDTNLGMPYVYLIYITYSSRFNERFGRRKKMSLAEWIEENNRETVK